MDGSWHAVVEGWVALELLATAIPDEDPDATPKASRRGGARGRRGVVHTIAVAKGRTMQPRRGKN